MQTVHLTVDPDEQFNQSAVGIAVKYLSIVLRVERAISVFSLTLSPREEKSCATLTLPLSTKNSSIS